MTDKQTTAYLMERDWDRERSLKQSTDMLMNIMRDFVPTACQRDAYNYLFKALDEHNIELTTQAMRERYRAFEKLHLRGMALQVDLPVVSI